MNFASRYADKTPPWGFGDLGYVVYKRSYARPIFDGDEIVRTEEWWETIHRVVNGAQHIGANLEPDEMERLFDYMFNLKGSVGGRMLWQLGTPNNERLGADSLVNCLSGNTMVPTKEGSFRIDELAEKGEAVVMTDYGKWVRAEIKQFDNQATAPICLHRGRQTKTVCATENHKWLKRGRNQREEVTTGNLKPGDRLVSIKGQGPENAWMSPDGVRAGLVYGDGSVYNQGSRAFLASADRQQLETYFLEYKSTDVDAGVVFRGLPRSYKSTPDMHESRGYLYGWLAGYFAADGYARAGKGAQINSTNRDSLQAAKDVAVLVGVATGPIYSQKRISNLTGKPSTIWTLPLHIKDPEFFLLRKHRGNFLGRDNIGDWKVASVGEYGEPEPVYCAIVPDTHTFALEDNLLTHNCWFTGLNTPEDFGWLFERLMLGGGVGFNVDMPENLGVVRAGNVVHENANDSDFVVPDKREGWSELLVRTLRAYLGEKRDKSDFTYSTQLIRSAGTPIKTFGGTASGPEILVDGIDDIITILNGAIDRLLTSTEVLDVANIIGRIVVSGNVRRSAQIALGGAQDIDYMAAKRWDTGDIPIWRSQSNNTIYANSEEFANLPEEFWDGYHGNGEPYGLFNLDASQMYGRMGEERPDWTIVGTNPCAEIGLAHRESCNLAELFLPNIESQDELVDLAKILYKIQKAVAAMPYLDDTSNMITSRNMRLGLGVTGIAQAGHKIDWLDNAYVELRELDAAWSQEMGYPESVRLTTVKPSGTLSLLAGVTPGVHPGFSTHHIRRVRMASTDPLVEFCRDRGYHVEPARFSDIRWLSFVVTAVITLSLHGSLMAPKTRVRLSWSFLASSLRAPWLLMTFRLLTSSICNVVYRRIGRTTLCR